MTFDIVRNNFNSKYHINMYTIVSCSNFLLTFIITCLKSFAHIYLDLVGDTILYYIITGKQIRFSYHFTVWVVDNINQSKYICVVLKLIIKLIIMVIYTKNCYNTRFKSLFTCSKRISSLEINQYRIVINMISIEVLLLVLVLPFSFSQLTVTLTQENKIMLPNLCDLWIKFEINYNL